MQSYFISGSNVFTFRVENTSTNGLILNYQDMQTLKNYSASLSSVDYNSYESLLSFTASLTSSVNVGDEFRATIVNESGSVVWNGAIQVFQSSSADKSEYVNQNTDLYISNVTSNEYIILT
jgi:hypothetical protein